MIIKEENLLNTSSRHKEIRRVLTRLQTARRSIDSHSLGILNTIPDLMEGGGWRKMVKGGKMARARSHCLPDLTLPIFRIGRKTTCRKREGGTRKRADLQAGVVGKRRAAWTTPLQRLACRSKLPICCVACCPDQLPTVIMCVCVPVFSVHTYKRASVSCAWQLSIRTSRTERRIYLEDLTLRISR